MAGKTLIRIESRDLPCWLASGVIEKKKGDPPATFLLHSARYFDTRDEALGVIIELETTFPHLKRQLWIEPEFKTYDGKNEIFGFSQDARTERASIGRGRRQTEANKTGNGRQTGSNKTVRVARESGNKQ